MTTGLAVGIGFDEVEDIVDEAVDDYLPLTGGTLSGGLRLRTANASLIVENPSGQVGQPRVTLQHEGESVATLRYSTGTPQYVVLENVAGTNDAQLQLYASYLRSSVELRLPAFDGGENIASATPKGYVDAADTLLRDAITAIQNLLAVDDTALDTLQEVIDRLKTIDPDLDGIQQGDVAGLVAALNAKFDKAGGTVAGNSLFKGSVSTDNLNPDDNAFIFITAPFRASTATAAGFTNANDLINKGYVDGNFQPTDQPRFTGDIFVTDSVTAQFVLEGGTGSAQMILKSDGDVEAEVWGLTNRMLIRHKNNNGGSDTTLNLFDSYANIDKEFRGVDSTRTDTFTTRGYVDDNFLNTETTKTQEIEGDLTLNAAGTNESRKFEVQAKGTGLAQYRMTVDDERVGMLWAQGDEVFLRAYDVGTFASAGQLTLGNDGAEFDVDLEVAGDITSTGTINIKPFSTVGSYLQVNEPLNNGGGYVRFACADNQSASYTFKMPNVRPTAGQTLEVDTVVGSTVQMKWVAGGMV